MMLSLQDLVFQKRITHDFKPNQQQFYYFFTFLINSNNDSPVLRWQAAYIRMSRYPDMTFVPTVAIRVIANSTLMWRFRYETKRLLGDIYQKVWVTSCSRVTFSGKSSHCDFLFSIILSPLHKNTIQRRNTGRLISVHSPRWHTTADVNIFTKFCNRGFNIIVFKVNIGGKMVKLSSRTSCPEHPVQNILSRTVTPLHI